MIYVDIIIFRDNFMEKLFIPRIYYDNVTMSVVSLKFDSDIVGYVDEEH